MKKSILNLGKVLNKAEQKEVNGGGASTQGDIYYRFDSCVRICEINKPEHICYDECSDFYPH